MSELVSGSVSVKLPVYRVKALVVGMVCLVLLGGGIGGGAGPASAAKHPRKNANKIMIKELEFKAAKVKDALRIVSELTGVNIVATSEAGENQVTLFVRHLSVTDVVDGICRIAGLWYRHNEDSGVFIVMTAEEYQQDIVVFRHEPTRMFQLKYLNVGVVARTIADLFGDRVELLGKANRHLGNDYIIGDTYEKFAGDYDKAEMDGDEDENDDEDEDEDEDREEGKGLDELAVGDLTVNQLAALQKRMKDGQQMISQGAVSQVDQRTESTIYVTVNRMHNMLFVRTADEKAMEEIAEIVKLSDQQVPEVLLEMKVLSVQLTDQFESAFDLSNISGSQQSGPDDGQPANPLNPAAETVGSALLGSGNFGVMENSTMVFQVLSGNLRARLQLLETNNNIKSLATPMLMAANNHPARLFIGEETVLTTGFKAQEVNVSGSGQVGVNTLPVPVTETRNIGNNLSILPSINADRSVVMRIVHENSTVETGGGRIPLVVNDAVQYVDIDTVNTSTLEGTVVAQDGMTIAVGGMMRTSYTDAESKVPVLGDIPGLGFFFKEQTKQAVKTELVLLITPHVLRAPTQGEQITRDRLKDLVESPSDLELYWDEKDRSGSEPLEKEDRSGDIDNLPDSGASLIDPGVLQKNFIEMTSVAVKQVRTPLVLRRPQGKVRSVIIPMMGNVSVLDIQGVSTEPVAAWTNGIHYITALKVINRTTDIKQVEVSRLKGRWRAATIERGQLAPVGEDGDYTYLYLISDKRFEKTQFSRFQ